MNPCRLLTRQDESVFASAKNRLAAAGLVVDTARRTKKCCKARNPFAVLPSCRGCSTLSAGAQRSGCFLRYSRKNVLPGPARQGQAMLVKRNLIVLAILTGLAALVPATAR